LKTEHKKIALYAIFYLIDNTLNFVLRLQHTLDLHKARCCSAFVLVELHSNVLYRFLKLRYHYVLKRVYSATVAFNLVGKHIAGFFHLRKLQKLWQKRR